MATIIEMTQLSPTMTEGTIVSWLKQEGDSVAPGEVLAEVETDKAVMEMESYDSGVILAILVQTGSKIAVGLPLAILGKPEEDIVAILDQANQNLPTDPIQLWNHLPRVSQSSVQLQRMIS